MTWKVTCVMEQRLAFVTRALDPNCSMRELCREFGISPKTGYKWLKRFRDRGREGLRDLSRRPKSLPAAISSELTCEIVRLRNDHPTWGPKKLHALLLRSMPKREVPSQRTIARVLARAGLVQLQPRRRGRKRTTSREAITPEGPNDLWTVDFKGWWKTRDGRRCEPLTIRDDWSRYVLDIRATRVIKIDLAREAFEEAFTRYGLPKAIRSDNGVPFACTRSLARMTRLSAWWKALGIELDRIDPGCPQQNGAHERMHKDIRAELQKLSAWDLAQQQQAFDRWREEFNLHRPHEALGMKTPAEFYEISTRPYSAKPPLIVYPDHFRVRRVSRKGEIRIGGRRGYFVSTALAFWPVGVEQESNDRLRFWFSDLCLGTTDASLRNPIIEPRSTK